MNFQPHELFKVTGEDRGGDDRRLRARHLTHAGALEVILRAARGCCGELRLLRRKLCPLERKQTAVGNRART
jgi:hypothetical protein